MIFQARKTNKTNISPTGIDYHALENTIMDLHSLFSLAWNVFLRLTKSRKFNKILLKLFPFLTFILNTRSLVFCKEIY